MRAPKKLYWVELETVGKLSFRQKGGGKFTDLNAAENRLAQLAHQGIAASIYETQPLQWTRVTEVSE